MFGGVASDCWIAVIAGGAAFLTFSLVQRFIQIKFFSESLLPLSSSRLQPHLPNLVLPRIKISLPFQV